MRRNAYPYDRNGHGTFVAGLISQATNNGIGVTGLAYETKIMPVRVLDYEGKGDVATIARGIRFAARHGAKIVNMSFEFDIGLTATQIPDVIAALRKASREGVVLVAAAGNTDDTEVSYPARAKHTIAVGATTEHGCLAEYSNTGSGLDIVAPGYLTDGAHDDDFDEPALESVRKGTFELDRVRYRVELEEYERLAKYPLGPGGSKWAQALATAPAMPRASASWRRRREFSALRWP